MEINHLPVIDWNLGAKLAGNKLEVAKEMLNFFMKDIKEDVKFIHQLYQSKQSDLLLREVHKMHSALCYCGLPRLKTIISSIEITLKANAAAELSDILKQLDQEVNLLINHHTKQT